MNEAAYQLTLRYGLLAGLVALLVAVPTQASGSPRRKALEALLIFAGFLCCCGLLAEAVIEVTLYVVPVSAVAIAALLFLVVEPKVSPRLRAILPGRRVGGAWVAWAVRALGIYAATLVYVYFMTRLSVGLFAAITLALGLLFLGGLLVILSLSSGPPANRGERLRRLAGITLVVLGMAMTFMGSFGVSLLFGFPPRPATGTGEVIVFILFGPVYYLGLPVFLLGLWLLGRELGRGRD